MLDNNIKNNICIFTDKKCLIYNNKRKLICSANKKDKLYKTEVDILCKKKSNNTILFIKENNKNIKI